MPEAQKFLNRKSEAGVGASVDSMGFCAHSVNPKGCRTWNNSYRITLYCILKHNISSNYIMKRQVQQTYDLLSRSKP